jgi:hypothetical protein
MATSDKRLVLIHGRGPKPAAADLAPLWQAALRRGVERDHGKLAKQFDDVAVSFVHFGDLMAPLLPEAATKVDPALDLADLRTALAELSERDAKKLFRSEYYLRQKGRSGIGKLLMMLGAPVARGLRMDDQLVAKVSPELAHYRSDAAFADQLRARLLQDLQPALARGEDVMLVAHCLRLSLAPVTRRERGGAEAVGPGHARLPARERRRSYGPARCRRRRRDALPGQHHPLVQSCRRG